MSRELFVVSLYLSTPLLDIHCGTPFLLLADLLLLSIFLLPGCDSSARNDMAPTSYPMALAVLVPLPFDIVFTILRFWIRSKRNAWGPDDWMMLINLVRLLQPLSYLY